ncbi:MAG: hypothetical protein ACKPBU_08490 [Alphaproteobacteria bacterium]
MSLSPSRKALALADRRVVLVPFEEIGSEGIRDEGRRLLVDRAGLRESDVDLLSTGLLLYRLRTTDLSRRATEFSRPSTRSMAIVLDGREVRPFVPFLNGSAWILDRSDVDSQSSSPELVAWLLAVSDRLRTTPDVTLAPVQLSAWWLERTDREREDFEVAAGRSTRPDARSLRAYAAAIPGLRGLHHARIKPMESPCPHRVIPGTELLVPSPLEDLPPRLVDELRKSAFATLAAFRSRIACDEGSDGAGEEIRRLSDWLAQSAPPLVIARRRSIVWSPDRPGSTERLEAALSRASTCVIRSVGIDLSLIADHSLRFLRSLANPTRLAPPAPDAEQRGYCFMHREAGVIAYDLDEPEIERLIAPAIPWAREMLGARCLHEWAHRAVDSGLVRRKVDAMEWKRRRSTLADRFDRAMDAAARRGRHSVGGGQGLSNRGRELVDLFVKRLPDHAANLVASRFWTPVEREVYIAQNTQPPAGHTSIEGAWHKLVRHLFEAQYMVDSGISHAAERYIAIAEVDLEGFGIEPMTWLELLSSARDLCVAYQVDEEGIRCPARPHELPHAP